MAGSGRQGAVTALEPLNSSLFSGAYDQVLARTAARYSAEEAPFVIGALALSGRLDEAESAFERLQSSTPELEALLAARFFLVAGSSHAGRSSRAFRLANDSLAFVRDSDPRRRFWACQGFAVVRYFAGRFRLAGRFAKRALQAAVHADFPYARFLALDLSAHVALQTGSVFAGMRLLSQARDLALALGWNDNAATLQTSASVYQLRLLTSDIDQAVEEVERRVAAPTVSYFTRRNAFIELACMRALRGDAPRALETLDAARRIALPGGDARGKTRWLAAHATCLALSRGGELARPSLEEARAVAGEQLTLAAEVGFVALAFVGGATPGELRDYERIHRLTGIQRMRVALDVASGTTELYAPGIEDGVCRVLLECLALAPAERVARVVRAGLLGLLPHALGRDPGKRIVLLLDSIVTENQGVVSARPLPSRPSLKLLQELARGYCSRSDLVSAVWGIGRYNPSRHTPVIHTAVSRLRLALGEPDWIVTHPDGYALAEGVELVAGEVQSAPSALPPAASPDERERVLAYVGSEGPVSSAEVAKALGLSSSTALRLLRKLSQEGLLARQGGGRSTRYARA